MRRQMASHPGFSSTRVQIPPPAHPGRPTGDDRQARPRCDPGAAELVASRRKLPREATLLATRSVMLAVLAATPLALWPAAARALTPQDALELLGKNVFFDTNLSKPESSQACASCHDPAKGWILPNSEINNTIVVAPGAKRHRLGSIKTPPNAYASLIPSFRAAPSPFLAPWLGGNFWDGRAEGCGAKSAACLGDGGGQRTITPADLPTSKQAFKIYLGPTADQALNPFPNDVEQNIREKKVCKAVEAATYNFLYQLAYGEPINCKNKPKGPRDDEAYRTSFKRLAVALAAWQASSEVNSFTSKRDTALKFDDDKKFPLLGLTAEENLGHDLFYGKGNCSSCHNGVPEGEAEDPTGTNPRQLYTDFRYHNLGVPFNREIPTVVKGEKTGLHAHVTTVDRGVFKTSTVRNAAKGASVYFTKAYAHNGWFKSLENIVHFYNTRDVLVRCEALTPKPIIDATATEARKNNCWPKPEFGENRKFPLSPTDFSLIAPQDQPVIPGDVAPAPTFGKFRADHRRTLLRGSSHRGLSQDVVGPRHVSQANRCGTSLSEQGYCHGHGRHRGILDAALLVRANWPSPQRGLLWD